jgi:hypothetical protein
MKVATAVSIHDVKVEQARRLSLTDGYVTRAADPTDGRPVPDDILAQRAAIRLAATALEAMTPIPGDYRADHHWL